MTDETTEATQAATDLPPDRAPAVTPSDDGPATIVEEAATGMVLDGIGAPIPEGYSDAVFEELSATYPEEADVLRRSWGSDTTLNTTFARRALEQIETAAPGLVAELSSQVGVASPKTLAALAALGRSLAATPGDPDTVRLDRAMAEAISTPASAAGRQEPDLQGEIDEITARAWESGTYYTSAVQEKLGPLYERLHGTARNAGRQA